MAIKCYIQNCKEKAGGPVIKQGGLIGNMIICDRHLIEKVIRK